jgi:transcriptional regulator with XRE-family HTH domain
MTPVQARMARAALQLSLRDLAAALQVSAMALSRYEASGEGIGASTAEALETFFRSKGVFCGPGNSVCAGQDVLVQERFIVIALNQLLREAGIQPSSGDIIAAYERARRSLPEEPQP